MIARHIHHALSQVHQLQAHLLEKQRFKGYSGRARAAAGTVALLASVVMSSSHFPQKTLWHVAGWGTVFVVGVLLNYGALIYWFFFDPEIKRDIRRLRPVVDAFPSLFVGGVFTLVFLLHGQHSYLFGMWMCLYGLTNLASYLFLPRLTAVVGLYYIACGTYCLLSPGISFQNPWPMGIVFFAGEWAGGLILHYDDLANNAFNRWVSQISTRSHEDEP